VVYYLRMKTWKPIPGWESLYEVSDAGEIRSPRKILKPLAKRNAYLTVNLTQGKRREQILIHRVVLLAFRGLPPKGHHACHNNGIRSDNRLANLRWDSIRNNHADKVLHGTSQRGEKHGNAILTEEDIKFIRSNNGLSPKEKAAIVKTHLSNIYLIINRRSWKHV